jgi:hypothetical protein
LMVRSYCSCALRWALVRQAMGVMGAVEVDMSRSRRTGDCRSRWRGAAKGVLVVERMGVRKVPSSSSSPEEVRGSGTGVLVEPSDWGWVRAGVGVSGTGGFSPVSPKSNLAK